MILPKAEKLLHEINGNEVWQSFGKATTIDNIQIVTVNPFVFENEGATYLLTNDRNYQDNGANDFVLLVSRKPTRADFNAGRINAKR